jgi:heterogeneous nuclear ribonucleoprotein F/H
LLNQQGLPRGEALVEFVNDGEASSAMSAMNKKPIGTRWIDIVPSTAGEIRAARSYGGLVPVGQSAKEIEKFACADYEYSSFHFGDFWVKLRGLPYSITKKDVADFLLRASVVPVGIFLSEGIGYVEVQSAAHVEAVLLLHKQKIGHRWVEIFYLSRSEAMQKAPQMQMQMQMHGYSSMHMQQAASAYMAYVTRLPQCIFVTF